MSGFRIHFAGQALHRSRQAWWASMAILPAQGMEQMAYDFIAGMLAKQAKNEARTWPKVWQRR